MIQQYLMQYPVATFIFVVTIVTTIYAFSNESVKHKLMLHPYTVYRKQDVYTVLTSGLIHGDWMHLFFNMFSYCFFGFKLEGVIGHWEFALLYIVSLVLSDLPSILKYKNDLNYYSLGASGAISAVLFSYILFFPMVKLIIMPIPVQIPAIILGPLYLIYCNYAAKHARDNVNHDAHFFGALSGIVITIILVPHVLPDFLEKVSLGVQSYFR